MDERRKFIEAVSVNDTLVKAANQLLVRIRHSVTMVFAPSPSHGSEGQRSIFFRDHTRRPRSPIPSPIAHTRVNTCAREEMRLCVCADSRRLCGPSVELQCRQAVTQPATAAVLWWPRRRSTVRSWVGRSARWPGCREAKTDRRRPGQVRRVVSAQTAPCAALPYLSQRPRAITGPSLLNSFHTGLRSFPRGLHKIPPGTASPSRESAPMACGIGRGTRQGLIVPFSLGVLGPY
jgi:hypothetical protein